MRVGKQVVSQWVWCQWGDGSRRQGHWLRMYVDRTVFLFDGRQRTWLWMTVARWCALGLNATRSLRYGGERWWKILHINVVTLKVIRNFIGSQSNCLRAGVTWDRRLRPRISRAAAFWTRWRGRVLMQQNRLVQSYSSPYEIWQET